MNYIGIDNGISGAITVLDADGKMLHCNVLPTYSNGKTQELDVVTLANMIEDDDFVCVESAQKFSAGVLALCSTWFTFGQIIAILKLRKIRHRIVQPREWQRKFWAVNAKDKNSKESSLRVASQLWPHAAWKRTERCSKLHDGMSDSALMAEFIRARQ
jgi:hypothetical protein